MFRNPRENSNVDLGRPPTPPQSTAFATDAASSTSRTLRASANTTIRPLKGMQRTTPKSASNGAKSNRGGNASILSFFKKAEDTPTQGQENDSLFLSDDESGGKQRVSLRPHNMSSGSVGSEEQRYNESVSSSKRRKTEASSPTSYLHVEKDEQNTSIEQGHTALKEIDVSNNQSRASDGSARESEALDDAEDPTIIPSMVKVEPALTRIPMPSTVPNLSREPTSMIEDDFEGMEDFADDEFPEEGEEHIARQWMEEQRLMELDFEQDDDNPEPPGCEPEPGDKPLQQGEAAVASCPICSATLKGMSDEKASQHVNDCLDGKPLPKLQPEVSEERETPVKSEASSAPSYKRFQRAAVARPGQENPFSLDQSVTGGSAFSKIMASHAEDSAWAQAAANEVAARGQPAYKRTCPFYKILPGFFTCVDAFRYGAVEGCHAYFLSHFHSDHYVGLTSSWCHGPIYCSKVTGNLVRQQLRVDPKWVVDLDWDSKIEVPRTQGVYVTMIPANHCPGSSLFLFEKTIGRGPKPKLQRILHCGDFRACPAHVQHPLLRPDVIDIATGKSKEQRIDVCYLDTTYLTPKYAFPRQEEVIKACADMCVSLSKEKVDKNDSFEQMKKQRAGSGMTRFLEKEPLREDDPGISNATSAAVGSEKKRGRLLVVVGTYSIGKERICVGVAKALNSKIFAAPGKQRICAALEDPELSALLTTDPLEAQVHMQMLMEIRAETLADYLTSYKPHFSRIVGFRPSGWNYRPPNSRFVESPLVQTVLHSDNWKPSYSMAELTPQRGSTREASCFGVPYSEHSSFRELTMFCCALRIDKIIPTVNVGSAKSREKMKGWIEKWMMDRRKHGLFKVADDATAW